MVIPRASGDRTRLTGRLAQSHARANGGLGTDQEQILWSRFILPSLELAGRRLNRPIRDYSRVAEINCVIIVLTLSLLAKSIDAHIDP
jgi:hypothetical protein